MEMPPRFQAYLSRRVTEAILALVLLHILIGLLDLNALDLLLQRYLEIWIKVREFIRECLRHV